MHIDAQQLFSNDQAITSSAISTNVVDTGASDFRIKDIAKGTEVQLLVQVTTTFATLTSLLVTVYTDSDEAFGSSTAIAATSAIGVASLVAGYKFHLSLPTSGIERYLRLTFTVAGSNATAGKVVAGLVPAKQDPQ